MGQYDVHDCDPQHLAENLLLSLLINFKKVDKHYLVHQRLHEYRAHIGSHLQRYPELEQFLMPEICSRIELSVLSLKEHVVCVQLIRVASLMIKKIIENRSGARTSWSVFAGCVSWWPGAFCWPDWARSSHRAAVPGGVPAEIERIFLNLQTVAEAAGGTLDGLFSLTVYLVDLRK